MPSYSSRHLSSVRNKLDGFSSNEDSSIVYCSFWIFGCLKVEENENHTWTCLILKHYFDGYCYAGRLTSAVSLRASTSVTYTVELS
jgi:hypothetical protein